MIDSWANKTSGGLAKALSNPVPQGSVETIRDRLAENRTKGCSAGITTWLFWHIFGALVLRYRLL